MRFLPEPNEPHYGLYPKRKLDGVYRFRREVNSHEIEVEEPSSHKNTYVLQFFTFSDWLRLTLQVPEAERIRLEDMLWNFRRVQYDTRDGSFSRFDEVAAR